MGRRRQSRGKSDSQNAQQATVIFYRPHKLMPEERAAISKPNGSIPIKKAWMPKKVSNSSDHQPEEQAMQIVLINERSSSIRNDAWYTLESGPEVPSSRTSNVAPSTPSVSEALTHVSEDLRIAEQKLQARTKESATPFAAARENVASPAVTKPAPSFPSTSAWDGSSQDKAMWGAVPRRRRSGCVVHHVPVSEGFHIMNVVKPDFQLGPPHKKRCGIQAGGWLRFDSDSEAELDKVGKQSEHALGNQPSPPEAPIGCSGTKDESEPSPLPEACRVSTTGVSAADAQGRLEAGSVADRDRSAANLALARSQAPPPERGLQAQWALEQQSVPSSWSQPDWPGGTLLPSVPQPGLVAYPCETDASANERVLSLDPAYIVYQKLLEVHATPGWIASRHC